ncbi:hypothetical protein QTH02_14040 [Clostridium perfringens]|nr:hypothetical protein [Clostridium perfringens]
MKNYIKRNIKKIFNKKLFYIILCFLFLIIPIILFILLLLGKEKSAIDSWTIGVGFYGALLGGLGTIIAFIVTSQQTNKIQNENVKLLKEQFYEDKRIGVKPFLDINISNISNATKGNSLYLNKYNSIIRKNITFIDCKNDQLIIEFNNIGLGPAINIKLIGVNVDNEKIDIKFDNFRKNIGSININENKFLIINFNTVLDENKLSKENFESREDLKSKLKILDFNIKFKFRFCDILENEYDKIFKIKISNYIDFKYIDYVVLANDGRAIKCTKNELKFYFIENECHQNLVRESR